MNLSDNQVEALLRALPVVKPSAAMDARVMRDRPQPLWRYVAAVSSLAAAAAVVVALLPHGGGNKAPGIGPVAVQAPAPTVNTQLPAALTGNFAPVNVEQICQVVSDEVHPGADRVPVREIRRRNIEKIVWEDKTSGVRIETTGQPREEVIIVKAEVN
jgi:hypothetical protein